MKKFSVIITIAAAAILAGCADVGTPSTSDYSASTNSTASTDSTVSTTESTPLQAPNSKVNNEPLPFTLFGADNVQITFADVTAITDKDGHALSAEELEDTKWWEIQCGGFAYLTEPSISLNSVDNADQYDPEKLIFSGLPEYTDAEYRRFKVGDKFGELTVKSASTTFSRVGFEDKEGVLTEEQIKAEGMSFAGMLRRCNAEFDGTVTMTGYMRVVVSEYGVDEGEVLFVPDKDSLVLPLMNFHVDRDTDTINTAVWQWPVKDFTYATEYPTIRLGNINKGTDISGISADGSSTRVKVTVTNISMFCDMLMSSFIDGKLVSVEPF